MIKISPSPILFELGPIKIYWYGFLIFIAFWLVFFISLKKRKKYGLSKEDIYNLSFWLFLGGLIGARLYHIFSELPYYLKNPLEMIFFWQGGLGIYGAAIVGFFVLLVFAKKKKIPFLHLLDLYAPLAILGLAIIRWGNFFNQELYGLPTASFLGIFIEEENRLPGYENFSFFHPVFLYESVFCFLLFLFLLIREKNRRFLGEIFFFSIFFYPIFRFFIEFIRIDYQPVFFSLRLGQWMGLFFLILFLIFLIKRKSKNFLKK